MTCFRTRNVSFCASSSVICCWDDALNIEIQEYAGILPCATCLVAHFVLLPNLTLWLLHHTA